MLRLFLLCLALLPSLAMAQTQGALPSVREFLDSAVQGEVPSMPKAAAVANRGGSYESASFSKEDIRDSRRLGDTIELVFETYIERIRLNFLQKTVVRHRFAKAKLRWVSFVQGRFETLSLRIEERELAGKKQLVMTFQTQYKGHEIALLCFRHGNEAAMMVFVDGKPESDEAGKPLVFSIKDQDRFDNYVEWFENRFEDQPRSKR